MAEKAYAQWNETGKSGRTAANSYASIEGGWMGTVNAQVLGVNASSYILANTTAQPLINALAAGKAVTIGTKSSPGNGLVGGHAYSVTAYDAATQRFTLFNPWNSTHPGPLTWAQLQAGCTWFTTANATSAPIASSTAFAGGTTLRSGIDESALASSFDTSNAWEELDETDDVRVEESDTESSKDTVATTRALATDAWFAEAEAETAFEASRELTPEAVDHLFDNLDALLAEALNA